MTVKHEIKSQLAKLLATEDLIVEHKKVETAQFNVHTRVLILPKWDRASNNVYDALVAHEVGHALYTPDRNWLKEIKIPPTFVNIVEDVRIEKLMKRRYGGLAKCFYNGYNELNDEDFFDIDGKDIDSLNVADRVNLYFKIGAWNDISFSDTETPIVRLIENVETFDETLSAAEALYNLCKEELENKQKEEIELDSGMDLEGGGDNPDDNGDDNNFAVPESNGNAPMEGGSGGDVDNSGMDAGGSSIEPEVETADALEDALKNLTDTRNNLEDTYFELPKLDLKKIIIDNKTIYDNIDKSWEGDQERWDKYYNDNIGFSSKDLFEEVDCEYIKFKRSAQKEVNYLVKEFECKKAASAYARSSTSRTGVLDTAKLHTYKFNEDLFKKVTVLPDGKNHGLIFILDWSGSMQYVLQDTLKQLYNLIWFCKKVQIPFDVYAFTSEYRNRVELRHMDHYDRLKTETVQHCDRKEGFLHVESAFNLLHFFTSESNAKELEKQMINIWRTAYSFKNRSIYGYPHELVLSGTPLNETLVTLHQLIPQFQEKTGAEKVQCIILTDGEGSQIPYNKTVHHHWDDNEFLGTASCHGDRSFLRDRKLGRTYKLPGGYRSFTDALLTNLKDRFPTTNFIGIRVLESRDARYFIGHYHYDSDKIMNEWKKTRTCTITNSGYDAYFAISSTALAQDAEFDVDDEATKAQIKRAFVKSLKTKKLNKKVLGEFIELVA